MSYLEVKNLKKVYSSHKGGTAVEALKNVNFSVEQGEYVAIMGESGSGKSTLLNILAALDKPTAGSVRLDGRNFAEIREAEVAVYRRDNLGFVFQEFNLLDTFTLEDNIYLPLVLAGKRYPEMNGLLEPIAKKLGIPQIVVGATIVSLGTTLPEILVSTTAAFDGSAAIAAGNAFGSIICNTALIAGLTQTIRPSKKIEAASIGWRSIFFFSVLIGMNVVGYLTGAFNRPVGVILLLLFCLYAYLNMKRSSSEGDEAEEEKPENVSIPKQFLVLAVCAALLYVGANLLVDNGIFIAQTVGIPERVIAVTFIALGTSLPELVTSIVSLIKGFGNVGLGNVIGANILNMLLVIGIPSAIAGIPLERGTVTVDMPLALLVMAVLLVPILIRKKSSRIQGIALLCIYVTYCVASFI